MAELKISGAEAAQTNAEGQALLLHAIKNYARAWFNYQGEGERWRTAFEKLRDAIALSGLVKETADEN